METNAAQSLLDTELEETKQQNPTQVGDRQTVDMDSDLVGRPSSKISDVVNPSSVIIPDHHSFRHSVLPFSKVWGYAKLHRLVVWVSRKEGNHIERHVIWGGERGKEWYFNLFSDHNARRDS
jgi:hypothetical protein